MFNSILTASSPAIPVFIINTNPAPAAEAHIFYFSFFLGRSWLE
jgi:hypothetical protein